MKKLKFLLLLGYGIASFYCSFGQVKGSCKILDAFLKSDTVRGVFDLDTHKGVPIVIVDINKRFEGCKSPNYYGRQVEIVTDTTYENIVNYSNIIVYDLSKNGKFYKMRLHFKIKEAYGDIYFRKRKTGFEILKFEVGHF